MADEVVYVGPKRRQRATIVINAEEQTIRLAEVQRRVRDAQRLKGYCIWDLRRARLYRDALRTLLDYDLPDDARQLIEAALEAEQ